MTKHGRRPWLIERWIVSIAATLALLVTWVPLVHSEPPGRRPPRDWSRPVALVALTLVFLVVALPLRKRVRVVAVVVLAGLTAAAWSLEDDLRVLLGSPFTD